MSTVLGTKTQFERKSQPTQMTTPTYFSTANITSGSGRKMCECTQKMLKRDVPELTPESKCPVCEIMGFSNLVKAHADDVLKSQAVPPPLPPPLDDRTSTSTLSIRKERYESLKDAQDRVQKWTSTEIPWLALDSRDKMANVANAKLKILWDFHDSFVIRLNYDKIECTIQAAGQIV